MTAARPELPKGTSCAYDNNRAVAVEWDGPWRVPVCRQHRDELPVSAPREATPELPG